MLKPDADIASLKILLPFIHESGTVVLTPEALLKLIDERISMRDAAYQKLLDIMNDSALPHQDQVLVKEELNTLDSEIKNETCDEATIRRKAGNLVERINSVYNILSAGSTIKDWIESALKASGYL